MNVKEFFETQYKQYSIYDSERSIANVIDGQKITSRKVLYTCTIRQNNEIKVAQLCSQVAYETSFHHSEMGIGNVIVNLAQNHVGSNNINLLEPIGQFGNRLSPVPAAIRYIFTKLSDDYRKLFKREDDLILEHNYDDDQKIEPKYYLPLLPIVLINGTQGIGTGFASKVLSYNPIDIKNDILAVLNKKQRIDLVPWYKNYKGIVSKGEKDNQWIFKGKIEILEDKGKKKNVVKITELPIGYVLDDIKSTLNKLKDKGSIKDYDDNSSPDSFDIDVYLNKDYPLNDTGLEKLYEMFKLNSKDTENLTLWNQNNKLYVFKNASEIIDYFVNFRLLKYEERRLALIKNLEIEIPNIENKIRFVGFYINNSLKFKGLSKKELVVFLEENKFNNIDDLLGMPVYSFTKDKINDLNELLKKKNDELNALNKTNAKEMYVKELKELKL